jgi:hypothetical protein
MSTAARGGWVSHRRGSFGEAWVRKGPIRKTPPAPTQVAPSARQRASAVQLHTHLINLCLPFTSPATVIPSPTAPQPHSGGEAGPLLLMVSGLVGGCRGGAVGEMGGEGEG